MTENARSGLQEKMEKAICALLSAATVRDAAAAVGIGEQTMHRWLREPSFAAAYRAARREAVQQAVAQLQQRSNEAATVLFAVMLDLSQPAPSRVAAAKTVLDMALRGSELDDLAARIEALERQLAERKDL